MNKWSSTKINKFNNIVLDKWVPFFKKVIGFISSGSSSLTNVNVTQSQNPNMSTPVTKDTNTETSVHNSLKDVTPDIKTDSALQGGSVKATSDEENESVGGYNK